MQKWFSRITPFTIICIIAVLAMLYFLITERNNAVEVRYGYLVMMLPLVLGMIIVDLILRYAIKKLWVLWIIEILLLFVVVYSWIVKD